MQPNVYKGSRGAQEGYNNFGGGCRNSPKGCYQCNNFQKCQPGMCRSTFSSCYTCVRTGDFSSRCRTRIKYWQTRTAFRISAQAGEYGTEQINVITNNANNKIGNEIIDNSFTEQCIIATGSYLSFVDKTFVLEHRLQIDPQKPGAFRVFIAAGESKIKAIGTVKLTLTFSGEEFKFEFQVVYLLSTNILLGINFILHYHCVPYANRELFTLESARVSVPMVVKRNCLGLAKLRKQVTLQPHTQQIVDLKVPCADNQSICLIEPIYNREGHRFCVPRTILSTRGYHCCQIWNPTDEPIHLIPETNNWTSDKSKWHIICRDGNNWYRIAICDSK